MHDDDDWASDSDESDEDDDLTPAQAEKYTLPFTCNSQLTFDRKRVRMLVRRERLMRQSFSKTFPGLRDPMEVIDEYVESRHLRLVDLFMQVIVAQLMSQVYDMALRWTKTATGP